MKKRVFALTLLALSCAKKEPAVQSAPVQPAVAESVQPSDALDSAMIAKMAAINPAEPWNNAKAYKAGEVIIFNNETWIAIRPGYQNTPPPDEWFWKKIIVTGAQPTVQPTAQVVNVANAATASSPATAQVAQTAPAQTVQPVTNSSATPYDLNREYKTGELVSFNGKTFVAKRNVFLNTNPTDSWFWEQK